MNLSLEKDINAVPEICYRAFTEPDHLSKWFTTNAKSDLRKGGRYCNDDKDEGEFLELNPFESVRFTWENKDHCPETEVETKFIPFDNKTRVILTHSLIPAEPQVNDMKKGWTWALENLKSYVESGKTISYEEWEKKQVK